MVLDLWERLHECFDAADHRQPEITIANLSEATMRRVIDLLLRQSRDLQTAFYPFFSEDRIDAHSPQEAVEKLASGELTGGFLVEPLFEGYRMPVLGIFSDRPGSLSIDYEVGEHWTPVALIALFELFRMISLLEEKAIIRLSRNHFERKWQFRFAATLREYLDELHV